MVEGLEPVETLGSELCCGREGGRENVTRFWGIEAGKRSLRRRVWDCQYLNVFAGGVQRR